MSRINLTLVACALFFLSGCSYSAYEDLSCTTDADCGSDQACVEALCVDLGGQDDGPGAVTTLNVDPSMLTLAPGEVETVVATAFDGDGAVIADAEVVWSSDAPGVASVDNGTITAIADGMTTVRAAVGTVESTVTVEVITPVESVTVEPAMVDLGVGIEEQLTATAFDGDGNELIGREVIWASDDDTVATIDSNGLVLGIAEGATRVTAQISGVVGAADVTVSATTPTAVELVPDNAIISVNQTQRFEAIVRDELGRRINPASLDMPSYSFASNPATLDELFRVRANLIDLTPRRLSDAVDGATLSVTATIGEVVLTDQVTFDIVVPDIDTVTTDPSGTVSVGIGQSEAVTFTATDVNGDTDKFQPATWESSDEAVATVDSDGNVVGVGPGSATITVTVGGVSTTFEVEIRFLLASISAGDNHACGLTASGKAYCWGDNSKRQLGDGGNSDSELPIEVQTSETFMQIVAGKKASCALNMTGSAFCWGDAGLLGDNAGGDQGNPVAVDTTETFAMLSASYDHICGVTAATSATPGAILCWGNGGDGRLGDGLDSSTDQPVAVSDALVSSWKTVAVGEKHTCAVSDADALYCWGLNDDSQLGDDTTDAASVPIVASTSEVFSALTLGKSSSCGLVGTTAYCWGDDGESATGTGLGGAVGTPTLVQGGLAFGQLEMGEDHACGIDAATGDLYCWGRFEDGRLGTGATVDVATPTAVTPALQAADVDLGTSFSCAIDLTGVPRCWGANDQGQLGIGSLAPQDAPSVVWPAP